MGSFQNKKKQKNFYAVVFVVLGLIVLHNQKLSTTDPENTYPKRIKRVIRLWLNPPENKLEEHLIGKGVQCEERKKVYQRVAAATVVIKTEGSIGAGVFIEPRLIVTADHVVDGRNLSVVLPEVRRDNLAKPGRSIAIDSVFRVRGLDLAFITTPRSYDNWLPLQKNFLGDKNLMVVGHPNGKFYSLQKARIKEKGKLETSQYVIFKDNEVFFGNSGGAIANCNGQLVGVVSRMSNYQNTALKQGIGINAKTIAEFAHDLKRNA